MSADYIEGEQLLIVLDCMMEDMRYCSIADLLGVKRNKVRKAMENDLLCQICQFLLI